MREDTCMVQFNNVRINDKTKDITNETRADPNMLF